MKKKFIIITAIFCALLLSNYVFADSTTDTDENADYESNVQDNSAKFSDVMKGNWYAGYITEEWTGMRCDKKGKCDFDGESFVNKLQAAKLLGAILNKRGIMSLSTSLGCEKKYSDLQEGQWYGPYVCSLISLGIINGEGNSENFGTGALNRITAVKIIMNALGGENFLYDLYTNVYGYKCEMPDWTDAPTTTDWYYKTAIMASCMGFISGVPNDDGTYSLKAEDNVNRAQFAKMLFKAKVYNTMAFYNRDLGTDGDYKYLIVSVSASTDANYLSKGLNLDAIEVTGATDDVTYLKANNLTAFMLHHDLKSNKNKTLKNMFGKPDYSSSNLRMKQNNSVLTGAPSYIVMELPADYQKVKIYDYSDGVKYNVYTSDKPSSVSRWRLVSKDITGINELDLSGFKE